MRALPVAFVLVGVYLSACGGATGPRRLDASNASATLPQPQLSIDYDLDSDAYRGERDVESVRFPDLADAQTARSAGLAVRRYYAAIAVGDMTAACALMYSPMAESLGEDYGAPSGAASSAGESCPHVAAALLGRQRGRLRADAAALRVVEVRVLRRAAAVRLRFGGKRRSFYMYVVRERGAWKMERLLANEQPIELN